MKTCLSACFLETDCHLSFQELAQRAFDAVKAAWETLSDPEKRETCENVIANAKRTLDDEIAAKRKEMRQKGRAVIIPEDDPNVYKQELHKKTVKVCRSEKFTFLAKI
jgi:curved DNA-binding protein CbpA